MVQLQAHRQATRLYGGVMASLVALCLLLVTASSVLAGTVQISDPAGVLNQSQIQSEGASLPNPLNIYTTNTFNGTSSAFDQQTRSHLNNPNLIVIAIDTGHHHLAIVGGSNVRLTNSQYNAAVQAFTGAYHSSGNNYTEATIAAIRSLRSSLDATSGSPGNYPNNAVPAAGGGFFAGLFGTLCVVGLLILAAVAVLFVVMRRRMTGFGGRGMPVATPYQQPYNQGYPPNYGPGYNQGSGINPLVAGGLGAAAGGLLGYELGKEQGENQMGDRDQGGNWGGGNDFGGGASGDFGGGGGGGDFGGGASGDFGGGGGGGDFGGGSGGGGGDF